MAKGFDVIRAKSAVKSHNKFDLSFSHLTTMDFGEVVPLLSEELVPGDKFSVKGNYFSRMAPLVKPTYGKFSFHTMATFVPYHQIADDIEAWLSGGQKWLSIPTSLRTIDYLNYVSYFLNEVTVISDLTYLRTNVDSSIASFSIDATTGTLVAEDSSNNVIAEIKYDWSWKDASGNVQCGKFEGVSAYHVKVLNALGYAIPQGVSLQTTSTWYIKYGPNAVLNAMPLLCFAKAFNDYMSQSTRVDSSTFSSFLRCVKEDKSTTGYNNAQHRITYQGIQTILNSISIQFENDYFVSAWESANAPIGAVDSVASITVPSSGSNLTNDVINNSIKGQYATLGTSSAIYQRTLDFLKSFDDWVRRNNYSGSREVQRVYSRFGIKSDDYRSNYSHLISTDICPIQVGDVTATAQTTDVALGDYAGKGIMSGSKGFSYDSSDYGMLFVFGWYTVTPMNSYGFDRVVLKTNPLDFYNPEFDGLGANAISLGEYFANPIARSTDTTLDGETYGFTERYNEYRYGRDKITGEFRDYHRDADMNTWHTGRLLGDVRASGNMVAQNPVITSLQPGDTEWNRIFSITDDSVDHFYLTAQFSVDAVRPMLSLNQVPKLGEGSTVLPRNGNVVN